MSDNAAQGMVGRKVCIGLGADGAYVGELLELSGANPWRGRVRITGVLKPALHLVGGLICRRGHRPGDFIEVAHANVSPARARGHGTYLEAVQAQMNELFGSHSGYQTSQTPWFHEAMGRALRAVHVAESRRLATGQWKLVPEEGVAG